MSLYVSIGGIELGAGGIKFLTHRRTCIVRLSLGKSRIGELLLKFELSRSLSLCSW